MNLLHYSQGKGVRLVLGVIVLLILFPVLFNIIFAFKDEVSYGSGIGYSTCSDFYIRDESERISCSASYSISLGNTGSNHQDLVTIDLASVPDERRVGWNVLDIVATNRRPMGPRISNQQLGDTLHFDIHDLEPNRLVEISILTRGVESATQLENVTIEVQAKGSVLEADPHMTLALRFLRNLGGIFGF